MTWPFGEMEPKSRSLTRTRRQPAGFATETGRLVRPISLPTKGDWVAWSPDGQRLATGHARQKWKRPGLEVMRDATQVAHSGDRGDEWLAFSPDGKWPR